MSSEAAAVKRERNGILTLTEWYCEEPIPFTVTEKGKRALEQHYALEVADAA